MFNSSEFWQVAMIVLMYCFLYVHDRSVMNRFDELERIIHGEDDDGE